MSINLKKVNENYLMEMDTGVEGYPLKLTFQDWNSLSFWLSQEVEKYFKDKEPITQKDIDKFFRG